MSDKNSIPWSHVEKPIEMEVSILGKKKFVPEELSRHILILGQTGVGKSSSVVAPVLRAYWNYVSKDGFLFGMLVVDPKRELVATLEDLDEKDGGDRLVNLSEINSGNRLNPFEMISEYPLLGDKMEYLFNIFSGSQEFDGNNAVFRDGGLTLLRDVCELEEAFFNETKTSLLTSLALMLPSKTQKVSLADGLKALSKYGVTGKMMSFEKIDWEAAGINTARFSEEEHYSTYSVFDVVECLLKELASSLLDQFEFLEAYQDGCKTPAHRVNEHLKQFGYYTSYWDLMLNVLVSEKYKNIFDLNAALDFDETQPGQIAKWLDAEKVLVITPKLGVKADEIIIMNLKRLVFNYMLNRSNMLAPMAYVADEFHNFISSDTETGEHNFLDRCRSYRVSCVLATQSVDSLSNRVFEQNGYVGEKALESMLNNISNRVVFRTTDHKTSNLLRGWIPPSPSNPARHVLDNFPLASLATGECYWIRNGEWSREQIELPAKNVESSKDLTSMSVA